MQDNFSYVGILLFFFLGVNSYQSCGVLFPRERQLKPINIPGVIQFSPMYNNTWHSFWEIDDMYGKKIACILISGQIKNTIVRTAASSCANLSKLLSPPMINLSKLLSPPMILPPFLPGKGEWENLYSLFLTAKRNKTIQVRFNQRSSLIEQRVLTSPLGVIRFSMSARGPIVKYSEMQPVENITCLSIASCELYGNWTYLSHQFSDTIRLIPHTRLLEFKVTLSNCFPDYAYGVYYSKQTDNKILTFQFNYTRPLKYYHTLSASIDEQVILSKTVIRHKTTLDCSQDWFLTGVRGANFVVDCRDSTALKIVDHSTAVSSLQAPKNSSKVYHSNCRDSETS